MRIRFDCRAVRIAGSVAAVAAVALLAAAPAQAGSDTSGVCTVTFPHASITPPFMPFVLTPASGTVTSGGQTGSVRCVGRIGGARITGPGKGGIVYAYSNGTCVSHVGAGTATWSIPTEAGAKTIGNAVGPAHRAERPRRGALPGCRRRSCGLLVPLQGDCVLTPLSKVSVVVAGTLAGT